MNDIDQSYNTDLSGLLQSAEKHNATVFTGVSTLSDIALAVGDYGHLPTFIERIRVEFNDFKYKIQTTKNTHKYKKMPHAVTRKYPPLLYNYPMKYYMQAL